MNAPQVTACLFADVIVENPPTRFTLWRTLDAIEVTADEATRGAHTLVQTLFVIERDQEERIAILKFADPSGAWMDDEATAVVDAGEDLHAAHLEVPFVLRPNSRPGRYELRTVVDGEVIATRPLFVRLREN